MIPSRKEAERLLKESAEMNPRYGSYPESKWKENFRLRDYFEQKTGKTLNEILLPDHTLN